MSLSVDQMRDKISNVYESVSWKDKVRKMWDGQVIAIYFCFLQEGKFEEVHVTMPPKRGIERLTEIKDEPSKKVGYGYNAVQLTIDDFLKPEDY